MDFFWKIGYKTYAMCFWKYDESGQYQTGSEILLNPLVGFGLLHVVVVDEHDLETSDISETISVYDTVARASPEISLS